MTSNQPNDQNLNTDLRDLVCGMKTSDQSKHHTVYEGKPYYFCSAGCCAKFIKSPLSYLNKTHTESSEGLKDLVCGMKTTEQSKSFSTRRSHDVNWCDKCKIWWNTDMSDYPIPLSTKVASTR